MRGERKENNSNIKKKIKIKDKPCLAPKVFPVIGVNGDIHSPLSLTMQLSECILLFLFLRGMPEFPFRKYQKGGGKGVYFLHAYEGGRINHVLH